MYVWLSPSVKSIIEIQIYKQAEKFKSKNSSKKHTLCQCQDLIRIKGPASSKHNVNKCSLFGIEIEELVQFI